MKKFQKIILFSFLLVQGNIFSQLSTQVEFGNAAREYLGSPKKIKSIDDVELEKTSHIKYLTPSYKKASISKSKEIYFLRYNIYSDEMEFIKNEQVFELNKEENQIIDFFKIKIKYAVFSLDDKLSYFLIQHSGSNSVLIKQSVALEKGKKKVTQFDVMIKPKFYREKDEIFIAFSNKILKKVPRKKKAFYKLFDKKYSDIKNYMSKNKLSHKKPKDLTKIVRYFNSIN